MNRLRDNIERKMGKDPVASVFIPGGEDYFRQAGLPLVESLQNFQPRFEHAVDVDEQDLRTGDLR